MDSDAHTLAKWFPTISPRPSTHDHSLLNVTGCIHNKCNDHMVIIFFFKSLSFVSSKYQLNREFDTKQPFNFFNILINNKKKRKKESQSQVTEIYFLKKRSRWGILSVLTAESLNVWVTIGQFIFYTKMHVDPLRFSFRFRIQLQLEPKNTAYT